MKRFSTVRKLLVCFLLVLVAVCTPYTSVRTEAKTKIKGIDVSRWQGNVDWKKVKKSGVKYVMLGLGRYRNGRGIPDPKYRYNIKQALKNGVKVGVYLYSEAPDVKTARKEAKYVLKQIDGYKISYPVAFDMEANVHRNMSKKKRTDIALAFLKEIEKAGYHPMIYASENWFLERMEMKRLEKYDKWVAKWRGKLTIKPHTMWQYSSTGKINGISSNVDLDWSYIDYAKTIEPRKHAKKKK